MWSVSWGPDCTQLGGPLNFSCNYDVILTSGQKLKKSGKERQMEINKLKVA
jgi:hypothetical protein